MNNAAQSVASGKLYHLECAPEGEDVHETTIDQAVCTACGGIIESDDEDDEDTDTVEEEED